MADDRAKKLLAALRDVLSPQHLLVGDDEMAAYLVDWRGQTRGVALCVARPATANEAAAVVRACAECGTPIVPQGGNTSLCGGATPDAVRRAVVLSTARMNRIRGIDRATNAIIAEAGCTLAAVQQAALSADRLFPLGLGSEGSCQIGGAVSTNAGGTAVLRYGNVRDLVLGLEIVLPDGEVWNGLRTLRKDNTGYDLKQLFIGAEGTLGLVTAAALKLFPRPRTRAFAWIGVASAERAVGLLGFAQERFDAALTAFELLSDNQVELAVGHLPGVRYPLEARCPWHVLLELSAARQDAVPEGDLVAALAEAAEEGRTADATIAQNEAQIEGFWRIRHAVSDANLAHGMSVTLDIAVPTSEVAGFLEDADAEVARRFSGAEVLIVAHLGDGNIHYIVQYAWDRWKALPDPQTVRSEIFARINDLAMAHRGTFSAEHGIGQKLKGEMARYRSPVELRMMRAVKDALDPRGLMNPGKLLPD
jgi:FAD/FMN-containing dehydrogenase